MDELLAHTLPRGRPTRRFSRVVRALRVERGLTLDALALEAGVSRKTIVNMQSGKHTPRLETLAQIAAALGISLADLIGDDVEPAA